MQVLQRADGGEQHRSAEGASEQGGGAVHAGDVAQHPRPERDRVERLPVAPHRGLRLRAPHEVAPHPAGEPASRLLDDFVKGGRIIGRVIGVVVHASVSWVLAGWRAGSRAVAHDASMWRGPVPGGSSDGPRALRNDPPMRLGRRSRRMGGTRVPAVRQRADRTGRGCALGGVDTGRRFMIMRMWVSARHP